MSDWKKQVEAYADCCLNAGFHGAAFRLREEGLALSEALSIVKEMKTFLLGYCFAAAKSSDKDLLMKSIQVLDIETNKLELSLEFKQDQNRKILG